MKHPTEPSKNMEFHRITPHNNGYQDNKYTYYKQITHFPYIILKHYTTRYSSTRTSGFLDISTELSPSLIPTILSSLLTNVHYLLNCSAHHRYRTPQNHHLFPEEFTVYQYLSQERPHFLQTSSSDLFSNTPID